MTARVFVRLSSSSGGAVSSSLPVATSHSPSSEGAGSACSTGVDHLSEEFGGEDTILRKTLFYLVSTLNAAFYPDYDFSNASSTEFSRQQSLQVLNAFIVIIL